MTATTRKGAYPFVEWIDLADNNVLVECAVLKHDGSDNVYFIRLDSLDQVDRNRIFQLITSRDAHNYPLWDLMSQKTLGNGENALVFFHQYVRVKTAGGQIIAPGSGMVGASMAGAGSVRIQE